MKNIKHLLFFSLLCSLVLFTNCGDSNDVVADAENDFIYLDENGVTIKASENAVIGENYELNGVNYFVVDRDLLFQMIGDEEDVTKVVTSRITDMVGMFVLASTFNQDISSWDVSNVVRMNSMFYGATSFNQDISSWDVSRVEDMGGMFHDTNFNQDISSWDVSNVNLMAAMFKNASTFDQDLSSWNVSKVIDMVAMFNGTEAFNQDIGSWDVSNVTDMFGMFYKANSFNQDLSSWNVSNVTECEEFSLDATAWTLPKPNFTNCLTGDESVWTGDLITFTKADNTDPNLAENQDRITDNVWLTRANNEGGQIYNAVLENESNKELSPLGTEWAEGDIENYASLTYFPFRTATVKPRLAIGNSYVMHLVEDNIYLSIRITSWSRNKAGGFSYERSTQ